VVSPSVIVALDGSALSRSALPVARSLARIQAATLHVLHVSEPALCAADAHDRLGVGGGDALVVDACGGDPVAAIVDATRRFAPSTVVLAAHSGHPRPASGLGSVAEGVLRAATSPLVVVPPHRGEVPWEPRSLLLPLDGTPGSAGAVAHAQRLARASGAHIELLHVTAPGRSRADEAGTLSTPLYADQPQHEWPAWRDEFRSRAACRCGDAAAMRVHVAQGAPGPETLRLAAAEQSDLILVAWHGVLDDAHAATLRTLLTGANCPVMVVRA
jgi:nucleotide-binding universal stress UspA family protein